MAVKKHEVAILHAQSMLLTIFARTSTNPALCALHGVRLVCSAWGIKLPAYVFKGRHKKNTKSIRIRGASHMNSIRFAKWIYRSALWESRVHRIPQNLVQFQKRCVTSKVEDAIWCNDIVENLEISVVGHIQGKNAWLLCVVYMSDEFIWANIETLRFHFSIGRGIVRNIM